MGAFCVACEEARDSGWIECRKCEGKGWISTGLDTGAKCSVCHTRGWEFAQACQQEGLQYGDTPEKPQSPYQLAQRKRTLGDAETEAYKHDKRLGIRRKLAKNRGRVSM